jgi:hypothetical protein
MNLKKLENVDLTKFIQTKIQLISNVRLLISLFEIFIGVFLVIN